ncbi:MAG: GAF domain-containing protein [Anaerolineales bacterium]|nr:GAF domain-containing protein [Anaerolineales bacterium]
MEIQATTAHLINLGFSLALLLTMFLFGLYQRKYIVWVFLCFAWGALGNYASANFIYALGLAGWNIAIYYYIFAPIFLTLFILLAILFAHSFKKYDDLFDLSIYGWSTGLGFAAYAVSVIIGLGAVTPASLVEQLFLQGPFYSAVSAFVGLWIALLYFRNKGRRFLILVGGLIIVTGYYGLYAVLYIYTYWVFGNTIILIFGVSGLMALTLFISGQLRKLLSEIGVQKKRADDLLDIVIPIGVRLSSEKDFQKLLDTMLVEAKTFCNADGGTLYLKKDNKLEFSVVQNDTQKINMGGASGQNISLPPIPLLNESGGQNHKHVAARVMWTGKSINIEDIYQDNEFDFSGTMEFDKQTGYTTKSILSIPLKDSKGEVQGVLQLLNALNTEKKEIIPFDNNIQQLMESFSSLASAALEKYNQEQKLRREIQELRIEIDQVKREKQVAEITDSDYFKELQQKAKKARGKGKNDPSSKK